MSTKHRASKSAKSAVTLTQTDGTPVLPTLDQVAGRLTHSLIAVALTFLASGQVDDLPMLLLREGALVVNAEPGLGAHRSRVRIRVVTAAGRYLHQYRPLAPVTFQGAEEPVDGGRVDLAWLHPTVGVFYDEVKTTRHHGSLSARDRDQLKRYATAGTSAHGTRFAGVRYLPLLNPAGAQLATLDERGGLVLAPLASTPLAFGPLTSAGVTA